jgi:tRNA pseudouridine38-40 synthase
VERATAAIPGDHSFRAFAKAGQEERGDRCIVHAARWAEWEALGVEFHVTANRFLHHMVRYLVGTLVEIGLGRRPEEDVRRLLEGAPGLETSPPAPPEGLFLCAVRYPPLPTDSPTDSPADAEGSELLASDLPSQP